MHHSPAVRGLSLLLAACGVGFAVAVSASSARAAEPAPASGGAVVPRDELLQQAGRCRRLLKSSVIDFYLPHCLDTAHGGYFEVLHNGRFAASGEKFVTLQARQLWFFSTLAAADIERDAALPAARHGFEFLQRAFLDPVHGGCFAKVADDGRPTDRRKHVYLNSFALYALAAYTRASDDPRARTAMQAMFDVLERRCHDPRHGGYIEFFHEDWRPIIDPNEPGFIAPAGIKTFNTHLHVLEALAEMHRTSPDPLVAARLHELLLINTSSIRLPDVGCNVDQFTADWRPVESPQNRRASYGHDVEGAWLCLDAARTLQLPPELLRGWAEGVVAYSLKHGFDHEHGGFYYTGPLGAPADDTKKEWWVQAEALVSMLELHRLTGRREYFDRFCETLEFIERHQIAKEGGWWATRAADGAPQGDSRTSMWQGAYHNGRALLWSSRLLEELAGKPGPQ